MNSQHNSINNSNPMSVAWEMICLGRQTKDIVRTSGFSYTKVKQLKCVYKVMKNCKLDIPLEISNVNDISDRVISEIVQAYCLKNEVRIDYMKTFVRCLTKSLWRVNGR